MSTLWALSGFLGLPQDWDFLAWKNLVGIDPSTFAMDSLLGWANQFNDWIQIQKSEQNLLIGYSLGGRLALHALIDRPSLWRAAVIVSAHAGLTDAKAREERQKLDAMWAGRFCNELWSELMEAWNSREVFAGDSYRFSREEDAYQRHQLAHLLNEGSLGRQDDLRGNIAELKVPILWITGSEDTCFCEVAQTVYLSHSQSRKVVISGAGHRVPWSQPKVFAEQVQSFLNEFS